MIDRNKRVLSLGLTLVLVALNLVALNYLISGWTGARIDMTENRMFSISSTTRRLLGSLNEDVTIYGYFSKRTHPKLAPLVPEIVDVLSEYRAVSRGRVRVEIFDPTADDEAAQEASDRFGVTSTPFRQASKYESGIVNAYFALVVRYADQYERYGFEELIEVEPMPDGDFEVRLRNLEYDLTRAIKKIVHGMQGIGDMFEAIESPVRLTAVVSEGSLPEIFSEIPAAVRTAAGELEELGGDKFEFVEMDPVADQDAFNAWNQRYGLRPMSLGLFSDASFYLYGLLEIGDRVEQLMLAGESITAAEVREVVQSSMKRHAPGSMRTIGVAAPEQMQLPPEIQMQMGMRQPPPEFQEVKRVLGEDYEVKTVDLEADGGVPADVDVLLVIKPQDFTETEVYSLDQYLMRGGRVVLCAGQFDVDFDVSGLRVAPMETGLDEWLASHGLTLDKSMVLDDRNQPLPIPEVRNTVLGQIRSWRMEPYPYLVQVRDEGFVNREVAAKIDGVGVYWGSPIRVDEEAAAELEVMPILRSSERSWTDDDTSRVSYVDYTVPDEGTEPQLLAVALAGRFESYFKDSGAPVKEADPASGETEGEEADAPAPPATVTLERSPETRLVLIGNAEFLSDFVARSLGRMEGGFFVENLRFVENVIDWVALDNDMLAIRSREAGARRLGTVSKRTEIVIETVNYLLPTLVLIAVGVALHWRRRSASSLLGGGNEPLPATRATRGEV